jgi:hypothetical protein
MGEHDEHVIQMNEVYHRASGWVQRRDVTVARMIDEPGHATGTLAVPLEKEMTMFKTISAALLAASMLAAPALAASSTDQAPAGKTTQAPASKTDQAPVGKTAQTPAAKTKQVKPSALNANAKMSHHGKHLRSHKHMGALKTHKSSKVSKISSKPVAAMTKRS